MKRLVITIFLFAILPTALLNGYALACPWVLADASTDSKTRSNESEPAKDHQDSDENPTEDDETPSSGVPVLGLPGWGSYFTDHCARTVRTFAPARSQSLPVGMWHGQSLAVPRPFSRLDRVVALAGSDAVLLLCVARQVRSNAPPRAY